MAEKEVDLVKESLRISFSDPTNSRNNRRSRWIHNKLRAKNKDSFDKARVGVGYHSNSNKEKSSTRKTDSGFQDLSESLPKFHVDAEKSDYIYGRGNDRGRWVYECDRKLRPGSSLPVGTTGQTDYADLFSCDGTEDDSQPPPYLSRQNGIRYSLRRPSASGSISSESEASQEGCENALNPSSALLIPNGAGVRKHSVLFSSYDAWNEDQIAQSFKEMSPEIGGILEAAWAGDCDALEEIFKDEEVLKKFQQGAVRDSAGRSAMHLAAACGHSAAVKLLIDKGGLVNVFDNQKATPLSCAASCGSVSVVDILLAHDADVNAGYDFGKTALHLSVQAGSVEVAKKLLEKGALQNPPAIFSETPLHIASTLGDAPCLQLLLDYGADVSLCKGTNKSQALHLAADEGNSSCIKLLLKAGASHEAKDLRGHTALHIAATCDADSVMTLLKAGANPNAMDSNGRTPLHCSVSRGSRAAECVRLLVENGAEIDAQDNFGYTPLHLAAVNESSQCASILLAHGADVTSKTKAGTSALTLLMRKIPDVMRYLVDRLDAAVTIHDHDPADPDCEIRLDFRGIVPNVEKKHGHVMKGKEQSYYDKPRKETEFLTCILAAGNKKILSHPLSEAFLTLKWRRVRKFFWASLLFQIALVALFTIFVVEVYLIKCPYRRIHHEQDHHHQPDYHYHQEHLGARSNKPTLAIIIPESENSTGRLDVNPRNVTRLLTENNSSKILLRRDASSIGTSEFSWFSVKPRFSKDRTHGTRNHTRRRNRTSTTTTPATPVGPSLRGFKIIGDQPSTTESPEYYDEEDDVDIRKYEDCDIGVTMTVVWGLLVAFVSLMGLKEIFQLLQAPISYVFSSENWGQWALIGSVTLTAWNTPDFHLSYWQYPAAACGIFLAWGLMLLQVGRFPALGLYVQMLGKVAANFGLFILAYACLLIAFALAFCVLFPEHPPYSSVPLAILKVLTMMVGEVDYEDLFYNEDNSDDPILYPITAHILHGAFVIIVTIVLMNLLVGLAVHDIQGLQKGAKLNKLSRQTALISRLESFIFSKRLQSCLPRSIGCLLQKSALLVPSSYNWSYYFRPNDPRDKRLPKDLKLAALRLAASKHSSRTIRSHPDARPYASTNTNNSNSTDTVASVRRIEQRLDKLQLQMELLLQNFNDKFDTLSQSQRSHTASRIAVDKLI